MQISIHSNNICWLSLKMFLNGIKQLREMLVYRVERIFRLKLKLNGRTDEQRESDKETDRLR